MSAIKVVRRLVTEVWNLGRVELLDELFTDPFDHGDRMDTVDDLRLWHASEASTWGRTRYEILDEVAGGDRVALRWRATASQVGAWGPVPATGRQISWEGVHFFMVQNGRIVAMWAMADRFAKAQALGVTFTPPGS